MIDPLTTTNMLQDVGYWVGCGHGRAASVAIPSTQTMTGGHGHTVWASVSEKDSYIPNISFAGLKLKALISKIITLSGHIFSSFSSLSTE